MLLTQSRDVFKSGYNLESDIMASWPSDESEYLFSEEWLDYKELIIICFVISTSDFETANIPGFSTITTLLVFSKFTILEASTI